MYHTHTSAYPSWCWIAVPCISPKMLVHSVWSVVCLSSSMFLNDLFASLASQQSVQFNRIFLQWTFISPCCFERSVCIQSGILFLSTEVWYILCNSRWNWLAGCKWCISFQKLWSRFLWHYLQLCGAKKTKYCKMQYGIWGQNSTDFHTGADILQCCVPWRK